MDAIALRPLRFGERDPVLQVFTGLSDRSRRLRFLGAKPRLAERELDLLVDVGRCGHEAVAAVDAETGRAIGLARFVRDADAPEAEIAFEVVDEWQGRGVGRRLVAEIARVAREQGILRVRAVVDRSNAPALALVRSLGDLVAQRAEGPAVELVVRLA
ncbi:MAG TPA: GNAT family N-acetyltransferase [Gaiellaceae bacterium]|nr:GNAT family N-acetyltransferase [Gaiellaceae bacterium]